MSDVYFIFCEDLLYVEKQNHIYELPTSINEIGFDLEHIKDNLIIAFGEEYVVSIYKALIDFPGVTENWKRRRDLSISRKVSHILMECLDMFQPQIRSAVFPIKDNNKIILVKPVYFDYYEIPGGAVEYLCNPEETAIREAKEETGLNVNIMGYLRTRSYVLEQINPTLRINPIWFVSIEFIGEVVSGEMKAQNEIEDVIEANIEDILNYNTEITLRNNLRTGLKLLDKHIKKSL